MNTRSHLLYIEDEEDDVFFMRNAFQRLGAEERFHAVPDGEQAVRYLLGEEPYADRVAWPLPGIVLLDLNLPLRSGLDVLGWLRAQPQFRALPVVVFSASGRLEERRRAANLGATLFLLKPASGARFLELARLFLDGCPFCPPPGGEAGR